ncbi:MAG: asparagine synthase (glutamine-hydrolyzing) [Terriglobia bacterium]
MCGIVGVCRPGNSTLRASLAAATEALRHRGPDDAGLEILSPDETLTVGLGARRLAILDTSAAGHQPMRDPASGNCIVHNGEVYNFRELRRALASAGHRFRSQTDTEVLLHSYAAWGADCVTRWRGMFATAVWDARRRRLLLFRDRLGIKPLYYCAGQNGFAFASEVRALLRGDWAEPRLDLTALDTFLSFGAVQEPLSIVAGVRALPPGHRLEWTPGSLRLAPYWQPCAPSSRPSPSVNELAAHLREAARLRLVSDVPVGVFLSGGIDSSSLVSLLSDAAGARLRTFCVAFPENGADDAACARRIARTFDADHREVPLDEQELLRQLPAALAAMDQPTVDGINTFLLSGAIRQAGLKVALSGLGGDELFGGYATFRRAPRLARLQRLWGWLPRPGRRALAHLLAGAARDGDRGRKLQTLAEGADGFAHPLFLLRALFLPDDVARLLHPDALLALDYRDYGRALGALLAEARSLDAFTQVSWLELRHYTLNTLLRDTDQMSMAHGLEVRVPLLDHQLVEAALALPGAAKAEGRAPKALLLGSLPRPLPREVVHRPKRGFTLPFERWLRGPLRAELEATLLTPAPSLAGILQEDAVAGVYREFERRRTSWSRVWALYVLKRWAESFGASR